MKLLIGNAFQSHLIELTTHGWFVPLKDVAELMSYITTILVTLGVGTYLTVKQFNFSKDKRSMDEKTKITENSIEVLRIFSTQIIPRMEEIEGKINTELSKLKEILKEKNIDTHRINKIKMSIEFQYGIGRIFNELEQVCVYMSNGLVDDDIVYPPLNQVLESFIMEHNDAYASLISKAPYKSLQYVLNEWTKKNKLLKLAEDKKRIEKEQKQIIENQ